MMLSRVADNIYWMSRYLERAASIARLIEVNYHLTLDMATVAGGQWEPLARTTGEFEWFHGEYKNATKRNVLQFLTFDRVWPSSIRSCLIRARENARTVREIISEDLWEEINSFYHLLMNSSLSGFGSDADIYAFYRDIKKRGQLIDGLVEETMTQGEGYHFFRMGRLLERADKTSRVLDVKYFLLLPKVDFVGTPYDDIQWSALLRTLNALDTYRRTFGQINPANIVKLLFFDTAFPRSVLFCLNHVNESLHTLTSSPYTSYQNPAEQAIGQLCADLSYMDLSTVFSIGLHEFIDNLQSRLNMLDNAIFKSFFDVQNGTT